MNLVERTIPMDACTVLPQRRILGIVLHHTAVPLFGAVPVPKRGASWHYLLLDNGLVYADVSEEFAAHHVASTSRWHPAWLPTTLVSGVSIANAYTIGIEIQYAPQHGERPTTAQHDALAELLADLYARYGRLPIVGHGELQLDKWATEPHDLDWDRFCDPRVPGEGRYLREAAQEEPEMSDEDRSILEAAAALGLFDGQALHDLSNWASEIWRQHQDLTAQVADLKAAEGATSAEVRNLHNRLIAIRELTTIETN